MITLTFNIDGQIIKRGDSQPVVSDSIGYVFAEFNFSSDWDGLVKTALFRQGTTEVEVVLIDDKCEVPTSAMTAWRDTQVSARAGNRVTANAVRFPVIASGYFEVDPPDPEDPEQTYVKTFTTNGVQFIRFNTENQVEHYDGTDWVVMYSAEEEARELAEELREIQEGNREDEEADRVIAETARDGAESARVIAEGDRVDEEVLRVAAEDARVIAEGDRVDEEVLRVAAESARVIAEGDRVDEEVLRVAAEDARVIAEGARVDEEADRVIAESARVTAEDARVEAEDARAVFEEFDVGTEYAKGNKVYYPTTGSSYIYTNPTESTGNLPTDTTYWQIIVAAGDMLKSIYDPNDVDGDAFDSANHSFDNATDEYYTDDNTENALLQIGARNRIEDTVTSDEYDFTGATITDGFLTLNFEEVV